jgi:hypothetical protein
MQIIDGFHVGKPDPQSSSFMRELVASTVITQTETYNEALLGKPNKEYQKWILQVQILYNTQVVIE